MTLASDLINTQRDLAMAHERIRALEALLFCREQEIAALDTRLTNELSSKVSLDHAIQELQQAFHDASMRMSA